MAGKKSLKSRLKSLVKPDSVETYRETPKNFAKSLATTFVNDLGADSITDMWTQIYSPMSEHSHDHGSKNGKKEKKAEGLKKGEEVTLFDAKAEKKHINPDIAPGIDYRSEILHGSERARKTEVHQLSSKYDQIVDELKRLAASSKVLQEQIKFVATEQAPQEVGTYHYNFVEWLLLMLRQARQKVEDSGAWLNIAKKKGHMLNKAWKQGNTSVTMSNERMVATQTG